jgi:PRTRC genetic system protein B
VTVATTHAVRRVQGRHEIEPGTPVTGAAVAQLARDLGRHSRDVLLPEHMLAVNQERMLWWCPASRRRIWFKPADKDHKDLDRLKKLNGKFVFHPPLLFVARGGHLRVLAMQENRRPTAETRLFRAPYWNLDGAGHLCVGTARMPREVDPALITRFEDGFFNSAFSHSHWGHQLTRHPNGHVGLWEAAAAFNPGNTLTHEWHAGFLVPQKTTVQSLITTK